MQMSTLAAAPSIVHFGGRTASTAVIDDFVADAQDETLTWFSLYVSKGGCDIEVSIFYRLWEWLQGYCLKGAGH